MHYWDVDFSGAGSFLSSAARLHSDRERESGFYTGKIEAVDFGSNKYWVTFDRPGVGKHLINDTEIKVRGGREGRGGGRDGGGGDGRRGGGRREGGTEGGREG